MSGRNRGGRNYQLNWSERPDGGAEFGDWSVRPNRGSALLRWTLFYQGKPMLHDGAERLFKTPDNAKRWLERHGGGEGNGRPHKRPCSYCGMMVDWRSTTPYESWEQGLYHSEDRCRGALAETNAKLVSAMESIASWGGAVDDEPESRKIARDVLHRLGHAPRGYVPETPRQWLARRRRERRLSGQSF